jgi:DNA-binding NtrC family response regulator
MHPYQASEHGAPTRHKVIIADDLHDNRELLRQTIEPEGYDSFLVPSGKIAVELAQKLSPDLIFLDISMPEMGGFEAAKLLKQTESTSSIPIIFITADKDVTSLVKAFEAGAVDYIVTPFIKEEVIARLKTHVQLYRLRRELEREIRLREQAEKERETTRKELSATAEQLSFFTKQEARRWGIEGFIGQSKDLGKVIKQVRKVHQSNSISVIITGESGVGKELIARAIHYGSSRARGPFVPINCSAIPKDLAESTLFGHVKGAFSGAIRDQKGLLLRAQGGTLFLDELGELSLDVQAKLLRALEENQITPVGGHGLIQTDVRIIAATHRSLLEEIELGHFREDLYYRLSRFCIHVPPLRQRKEDIQLLAHHFAKSFAYEMGRPTPQFTLEAMERLEHYQFPGNVRELKNLIERAVLESEDGTIQVKDLLIQHRSQIPNSDLESVPNHEVQMMKPIIDSHLLSEEESIILNHVRENGRISNKVCRKLLEANLRRANYLLNRMVKDGHLSRAGSNRNAFYLGKDPTQ